MPLQKAQLERAGGALQDSLTGEGRSPAQTLSWVPIHAAQLAESARALEGEEGAQGMAGDGRGKEHLQSQPGMA